MFNSGKVMKLSDAEVPQKYYNRIRTGIDVLDQFFGGEAYPGILPGASILMTGFPGAGKTTAALKLADVIKEFTGKRILYNTGEQGITMMALKAREISLNAGFEVAEFGTYEELRDYCNENGVEIVIQDSLQTLMMKDGEDEVSNRNMKQVGKNLCKLSNADDITMFIIGQITKGGEFRGPNEIAHFADAHMHLYFDKDTGNRVMELKKNRFGPAMFPYEFMLTGEGIDFRQMDQMSEEKATTVKKNEREDNAIKKAQELLLAGHKLSGYSHEDNKDLAEFINGNEIGGCSGNWWRGVLRKAASKLEHEGHVIKKAKINLREHVFVANVDSTDKSEEATA